MPHLPGSTLELGLPSPHVSRTRSSPQPPLSFQTDTSTPTPHDPQNYPYPKPTWSDWQLFSRLTQARLTWASNPSQLHQDQGEPTTDSSKEIHAKKMWETTHSSRVPSGTGMLCLKTPSQHLPRTPSTSASCDSVADSPHHASCPYKVRIQNQFGGSENIFGVSFYGGFRLFTYQIQLLW